MRTTFKRTVAFMLSMLMVLSVCSTALVVYAVEGWPPADSTIDYVSLGASNTNGYGHRGYLPGEVTEDPLAATKADLNVYGYGRAPENAYPAKIAKALELSTGKEVNLHQLAISSMRTEELRVLLDNEYYGDEYTEWRFTGGQKWFEIALDGGIESLRDAYQSAIKEAELVTIDIGWNNFGVYAFNNLKVILSDGRYWKAPQFDDFWTENELIDYENIKKTALDYLNSDLGMADPELQTRIEMIADVLTYATIGACYHFDAVLEKIYELNPDVTVVSLNIQNLADGLVVNFEGTELMLGDIYGKLIEMTDLYRAYSSPYADKYLFADAGDIDTFLDEIVAWDGDPTTLTNDMKDCFDMYDDSLYVRSIVEYLMVGQALSGVFKTFRDMAAEYGLPLFVDSAANAADSKGYVYDFALTRPVQELLSLDLSKLDFNNPSGSDSDIEYYGAAVSAHLRNLRAQNYTAYDYAFEQLIAVLNAQKAALMANAEANATAIAEIDAALTSVIPTAQAQFKAALMAVYTTYQNTLNYAYDIIATFVQCAAKHNTIAINSDGMSGFDAAEGILLSTLMNDFISGAQIKFNYELNKNGLQNTGVTEDPVYILNESIFDDPAVLACAVLAVRYELGNSFYAHPSTSGYAQITGAVLEALANGPTAEEFFSQKTAETILYLISEYYDEVYMLVDAFAVKNADYTISKQSTYVAFGDNAKIAADYASYLTNEIQNKYGIEYNVDTTYAIDDSRITTLAETIATNPAVIAEADLISINYGLNKITEDTLNILFDLLGEGSSELEVPLDWAALAGDEIGAEIKKYVSEIKTTLDDKGLNIKIGESYPPLASICTGDLTISEAATRAIEYFAYYTVEYLALLPAVVMQIKQINPEAIVMINALSNPAAGAGIALDTTELMFGDYFDTLVELVYMSTAILSMTNENVVLVPTTQVKTTFTGTVIGKGDLGIVEILFYLSGNSQIIIDPTDDGNAYVLAQMEPALNIVIKRGDFNFDGKVTVADAIYLMQNLTNPAKYTLNQGGDVNGDGALNSADVTYLLRNILSPSKNPLK